MNRLAGYSKYVAMLRCDNRDTNIDVGQQLVVLVVHNASRFSDVACAMQFYDGRDHADRAFPGSLRQRIPSDLDLVPRGQASKVGLVHERSYANLREIRFLQYQIAGIEVCALQGRQRIDDPIKW